MRIGDAIEKVTKAMGIKSCNACKKRREFMNGLTWKEYRKRNPRK